jgi:lipoyl(octanoyl) transferase
MERRAAAIATGQAAELVWLLEHPPLYTMGTSAKIADLVSPARFPVFAAGRGGQFTYHGPGQRVVYVMLDVRRRYHGDVRAFVSALEDWMIDALAGLGVEGERRCGRVGIWVRRCSSSGDWEDAKIAALGVRISRGVSQHGISLNVAPNLEHFDGIVPCGIRDAGVTSLRQLGLDCDMAKVDAGLRRSFERRIGTVLPIDLDLSWLAGLRTQPGEAQ